MILDINLCRCGHYKMLHRDKGMCLICNERPFLRVVGCARFRWRWLLGSNHN